MLADAIQKSSFRRHFTASVKTTWQACQTAVLLPPFHIFCRLPSLLGT
jgi:hypothetical protein